MCVSFTQSIFYFLSITENILEIQDFIWILFYEILDFFLWCGVGPTLDQMELIHKNHQFFYDLEIT